MEDGSGTSSGGNIPQIMVFRPTWEEFQDFNSYILHMEKLGAHEAGLAKIIPPPEWEPCPNGYNFSSIGEMEIPSPISQMFQGKQGVYQILNILKKPMKVKDYKKLAYSPTYASPLPNNDSDLLHRRFWQSFVQTPPIYGADVPGTLMDPTVAEWNLSKLGSILDYVNDDYGVSIDGVNTPYLYFGMWRSAFAWHTEDLDLYSINYLHFGEPKSWYCVPPKFGARLERLSNNYFPNNYKECPAFLRHKMTLLSPAVLKNNSIPFNTIVQEAGEFMVTFPFGYHAGFNHGYNCAESTNFASPRWVEYGKWASRCACCTDTVKINMDTFIQRFQPEKYDLWLQGKDFGCHPEIPGKLYAAPHPSPEEVLGVKNESTPQNPEGFQEQSRKRARGHLFPNFKLINEPDTRAKIAHSNSSSEPNELIMLSSDEEINSKPKHMKKKFKKPTQNPPSSNPYSSGMRNDSPSCSGQLFKPLDSVPFASSLLSASSVSKEKIQSIEKPPSHRSEEENSAIQGLISLSDSVRRNSASSVHPILPNSKVDDISTGNASFSMPERKLITSGHLPIGLQVYATHPESGRIALAEVVDNKKLTTRFSVDFLDGSKSEDVLPEEILNYDCSKQDTPAVGTMVVVKWPDGVVYVGSYRGQNQVPFYHLKFIESADEIMEIRSEISLREELSDSVRHVVKA